MTRIRPLAGPSTYERLHSILRDHFGRRDDLIAPDATFTGALMLDGLDMVDLVSIVNAEFAVELAVDDAHPLQRVDDLVRQVERLRGGRRAG